MQVTLSAAGEDFVPGRSVCPVFEDAPVRVYTGHTEVCFTSIVYQLLRHHIKIQTSQDCFDDTLTKLFLRS